MPRVLHWGLSLRLAVDDEAFLVTLGQAQHGADGLTGCSRFPSVLPGGHLLGAVGLQGPTLYPEHAPLFRLVAAGAVEAGR